MPRPDSSTRSPDLPLLDAADLGFLGACLDPVAPPPQARDRILARVLARVRDDAASAAAPVRTLHAEAATWLDIGPGVQMQVLDDDGRFRTFLLRLAAGARLPDHGHQVDEECYVIEGDIWVAGELIRRGDYQRVPAGVVHGDIHSDGGCLLHIRGESTRRPYAHA